LGTQQFIRKGGEAEDTRRLDAAAAEITTEQGLALLRKVNQLIKRE
jgi:hypothetical protein